ncbi:4Fe-4S ferredoxin-type domain-containing protein [Entamoeba marina]
MSQIKIDDKKCIGCGKCIKDCPSKVISLVDGKAAIKKANEDLCLECGQCASICKEGAISFSGVTPKLHSKDRQTVIASLKTVRSVRQFKGSIPNNELKELINIAKYAPTSKVDHLIQFVIINRPKLTQILVEIAKNAEKSTSLSNDLKQIAHSQQEFDVISRGAPHMVIAYADEKLSNDNQDANVMFAEIELAAISKGYGSFWCNHLKSLLSVPGAMEILGLKGKKCMQCMGLGIPAVIYSREVPHKEITVKFFE